MTVITIEDEATGHKVRLKIVPKDILSEKGKMQHVTEAYWDTKLEDIIKDGSEMYKTALNKVMTEFGIFKNRQKVKR